MLEYNHKQDDTQQKRQPSDRNGKLQERKESFCKKKGKQ